MLSRPQPRWAGAMPVLLSVVAIALLGVLTLARAEEPPPLGPGLEARGWRLFSHPRWDPARFALRADGSIEVTTDNSTALIYRKIPEADRRKRYLTWRWRVEENMTPTDITVKGGDDRPLALHVWFMDDPDRIGFWQGLRNGFLESIFGIPLTGKVLTYVWGGQGRRGDAQPNPHIGEDSWMIVLRPGATPLGRWYSERIDVISDFEKAFGYRPGEQNLISLAADSEDTRTRSSAAVADIAFTD